MSDTALPGDSNLDDIVHRYLREVEEGGEPDQEAYLREFSSYSDQLKDVFRGFDLLAKRDGQMQVDALSQEPKTVIDGKYRLIEEVGRGGMGHVWLARQIHEIDRLVAIKFVLAGMDSQRILARFEFERQVLEMLNHPNIATIIDAGMTEQGRPYFVMEYVEGISITDYCNLERLNVRQRLELFLQVCDAVQHSHQVGIIHRDLKPSNIMISLTGQSPVAKVIDFGLAKAMAQSPVANPIQTGCGRFAGIGTPRYMSPEQAGLGDARVDVRCDVYSMGVVLYELLVDSTPLVEQEVQRVGSSELEHYVRDFETPLPSTRLRTCRDSSRIARQRSTSPTELLATLVSELDWVVMRSLEKDKSRRYQSIADFRADIERFLSGRPVLARPPSIVYRANKFVRQHRAAAISAAVVVFIALALVAGMTADLYRRRLMEQQFNLSQIEYLRAAEAASFSRRLSELKTRQYDTLVKRLGHYQRLNPPRTDAELRRDNLVHIALLGELPNASFRQELVMGIEADEILAIAASLNRLPPNEHTALRNLLSESLSSKVTSSYERLKLLGLLCQIEKNALHDPESLDELASNLCDLSKVELASWRSVFQPLSEELVTRLEQIVDDSDADQSRRINAASLWVSYQSEDMESTVEKGLDAPSAAYEPFVAFWKSNPEASTALIVRYLADKPDNDVSAERYARAAIGLANLGAFDSLRQCFSGSLGESVRARAITLCKPRLVPFEMLAEELPPTESPMERASIIAALGSYPIDKLRKGINQSLIDLIQREFRTNPASTVHGACESTLVRWKVPLPKLDALPETPREGQRWFRSPKGIDLVTLDIPAMAATNAVARPGYRVAVGSREVTIAQFLEFLNDDTSKDVREHFQYKIEVSPQEDCPQNAVNWYVGAMYCNWLSLQEGTAEDQLCFESDPQKGGAPRLKTNAESLSGYRFPSVTEAKVFCGGVNPPFDQARPEGVSVMSNFPWGNDAGLLNEFAYTAENAMGRTWPAGHRLPNDLGMHDTLGSLLEWTITLDEKHRLPFSSGGNYINALPELFYVAPNALAGFGSNNFYFGFRVARTLQ